MCEDNSGSTPNDAERLIGLTLTGNTFTFAKNNIVLGSAYNAAIPAGDYRQSEWAGACYSPDGKWLFVNIQTPGVTFAITGSWAAGRLSHPHRTPVLHTALRPRRARASSRPPLRDAARRARSSSPSSNRPCVYSRQRARGQRYPACIAPSQRVIQGN